MDDALQAAADEMQQLILDSRRKLLEFEVMMAEADIAAGKTKTYKKASDLIVSALV